MTAVLSGFPECRAFGKGLHRSAAKWNVSDYAIIHIETVEADIGDLERRLCAKQLMTLDTSGSCQRLPRLVWKNDVQERSPARRSMPPWRQLWKLPAVRNVIRVYQSDFAAFGYSTDPQQIEPLSSWN